jgi:phage head maturation protease
VPNTDDETWTLTRQNTLPLRRIYRAQLFDVSPVTFPAYAGTSVEARTDNTLAVQRMHWAESELARARMWR